MISGSVASIQFGEPRVTLDVDVAISMTAQEAQRLPHIYPAPAYYCPPKEILTIELKRPERGHFNVIHLGSGLKADFYPGSNDPLVNWAMAHRRKLSMGVCQAWFAPPEYVILWKLEFYREGGEEKHVRDIRGMLAVSGDEIDRAIVENGVAQRNLQKQWQACLAGGR